MRKTDQNIFRRIFQDHWEGFKEKFPYYDIKNYNKNVEKMLGCGREEGGYSEYMCPHCGGDLRRVAFTCKGSFCLSCAQKYTDDFVAQISKMLRPGLRYRHIVLTIPEQLRPFFYKNRFNGKLLSAFMRCGYSCLEDVLSYVLRQKVKIGAIIVVQTHGRSGKYNPHLHIIMTSGGINEETRSWRELGYFPYEIIHKKWQYYLLKMLREFDRSVEIKVLINDLYGKYPKGFVAYVTKGDVPEKCRGLARYLAKYVASPPIAVRRLIKYTGKYVTYWYKDHKTKRKETLTVDVYTFIGRMVQHIMPKNFQRVRYYGLQATKTFTKWSEAIKEGLQKVGRVIKGVYEIIREKTYRERYQEMSGKDPFICRNCGREMILWKLWHPDYGVLYDEEERMRSGMYDKWCDDEHAGGQAVRPATGGVQLSLFSL